MLATIHYRDFSLCALCNLCRQSIQSPDFGFLNKGFPIIKGKEEGVDCFVCPNAGNNVSFADVSVISGHEMNTKYRLSYSRHSLTALWSKGRHARVFDVQPWAFPLSPLKCDLGSVTFSVRNLTDHSI